MDVGDLLDFQSTLQHSSALIPAPNQQKALFLYKVLGCHFFEKRIELQHLFDLPGKLVKPFDYLDPPVAHGHSLFAKLKRNKNQRHKLASVCLRTMTKICTFVLATPTSGPAFTCTPQCVSREMLVPTTFVTPTHRAPLSRQYLRAISVSAVSPDWLTKKQTSSRKMGDLRSKKSLASSATAGISTSSSKTDRVYGQKIKPRRLQQRSYDSSFHKQ